MRCAVGVDHAGGDVVILVRNLWALRKRDDPKSVSDTHEARNWANKLKQP
jgi:hypothetical protein